MPQVRLPPIDIQRIQQVDSKVYICIYQSALLHDQVLHMALRRGYTVMFLILCHVTRMYPPSLYTMQAHGEQRIYKN